MLIPDPNDSLTVYLQEIRRLPRMTDAESLDCARRIDAGKTAADRLKDRHEAGADEVRRLRDTVLQAKHARDTLVRAHLRLVVHVAWKYQDRGLPLLDLIQEGNIGLIRAAEKWDYRRGARFGSYAYRWIDAVIKRALVEHGHAIRLSDRMTGKVSSYLRAVRTLMRENDGRAPTVEQVADLLDMPPKRVQEIVRAMSLRAVSPTRPPAPTTRERAPGIDAVAQEAVERLHAVEVRRAVTQLAPEKQRVVNLRFGFGDGEPRSQGETARVLGTYTVKVHRIEKAALRDLASRPEVAVV